jgi:hypothetical protein
MEFWRITGGIVDVIIAFIMGNPGKYANNIINLEDLG